MEKPDDIQKKVPIDKKQEELEMTIARLRQSRKNSQGHIF
jgi:hypothetical protein